MVCCYRRATNSQRRSTTTSWPLGVGQLWLVSTALLFFFIDSVQLLWLWLRCVQATVNKSCGFAKGKEADHKGQWVYGWIKHSGTAVLSAFQSPVMSTDRANSWCHLLGIQTTMLPFPLFLLCPALFPLFFFNSFQFSFHIFSLTPVSRVKNLQSVIFQSTVHTNRSRSHLITQ